MRCCTQWHGGEEMKCNINGSNRECKIIEKMGYQGGYYVRLVASNGREYVVIKDGEIWRTVAPIEKIQKGGCYRGQ